MKSEKLKKWFRTFTVILLLTCPVCIMFWIWSDARSVPFAVLSGQLFRAPWRIVHAGFCMDQPTIGKWYFWTTFFSGIWMASAFAAYLLCRSDSSLRYIFVSLVFCALAIYILLLTVPFFWTIQYINAMGITSRRRIAFLWGFFGYATLISLTCLMAHSALKQTANTAKISQ